MKNALSVTSCTGCSSAAPAAEPIWKVPAGASTMPGGAVTTISAVALGSAGAVSVATAAVGTTSVAAAWVGTVVDTGCVAVGAALVARRLFMRARLAEAPITRQITAR